ncbi:MAG TPA: efflux RND transporter permease subunit, partial [Spirochaetota bacterium]|nr:efflux RND transporter permease subunit [Spirochaetota bacterium]
ISSIQRRNVRSTGGTLQSVTREKNVVTIGEFETPAEAGAVIIRSSFEEKRVRIKDVADIKEGFEKAETMVRVNRSPGVTLSIVKKENADVVETVRRVKKWLRQNSNIIPKNLKLNIIDDRSLSIIALLNVVKSNALIGFILVFIILFIFLDLRSAFWTAFGIPVTILMILSVMNFFDISLNIISLGAVITVLGMLVDHGIVISENIYSSRLKGLTGIQAALQGLKEVFTPVVITILTTIAAFLPLLFIKGMMGKFIYIYPIIITIALSASFIEAVFFLPNHLAHARQHSEQMIVPWFEAVISFYKKVLRQVIRYRYLVAAAFIIIFILTFVISRGTIKNYTLFWDNSSDAFYINLEAPQGTSLAQTAFLTKKIEQIVTSEIKKKERLSIRTIIGHHTVKRIRSRGNHENWSQITVFLKPQTERERNVEQIIRALRKKINPKKIKSFDRIMFAKQTVGPSPGKALEIKVVGGAEHDRYAAAAAVEKFLLDQNGVIDVDNDHKKGKEELKIVFDYNRLAKLNMDVASVARTVRTAYEGTVATSMQTMGEEIDFRVMIAEPYKKDSAFLKKLLIPNKQGKLIRLGDIAAFKAAATEAMLNHYNGERAVTLTAKVDRRQTTAGLVMHTLKKQFNNVPEKYNGVYLVEKGESAETTASARDLLIAFSIALLAIYLILVLLFNSLIQPVIILITVPFGLTGALLSFTAHSIPLNFMGLIGIIGLSGVVVNDSVVMVSFINTLIKEKKQGIILENIIQGASLRLRPVILTTLTTAAGLFPTVYGIGGSVSSLRPTVMGLSYGILFATLLTLFLIPALYVIAADLKQKSGSS